MRSISGRSDWMARGVKRGLASLRVRRVLGRIHVQQVARDAILRRLALRKDRQTRAVVEELRLARDAHHVRVLRDREEGRAVAPGIAPEDRRLAAQPRPRGVWVAVSRIGVGPDEVERRERQAFDLCLGDGHDGLRKARAGAFYPSQDGREMHR